jgi:hypothetical protein
MCCTKKGIYPTIAEELLKNRTPKAGLSNIRYPTSTGCIAKRPNSSIIPIISHILLFVPNYFELTTIKHLTNKRYLPNIFTNFNQSHLNRNCSRVDDIWLCSPLCRDVQSLVRILILVDFIYIYYVKKLKVIVVYELEISDIFRNISALNTCLSVHFMLVLHL